MAFRASLLLKKLDSITYEEFHQYWEGPHADIFLGVPIVQEKVIKFSQFHTDRAISEKLAEFGASMSEFDGEVNLWFASFEDCMVVLNDPEYQRLVVPDADNFSKSKESKLIVGYDKDFIADGKPLQKSA